MTPQSLKYLSVKPLPPTHSDPSASLRLSDSDGIQYVSARIPKDPGSSERTVVDNSPQGRAFHIAARGQPIGSQCPARAAVNVYARRRGPKINRLNLPLVRLCLEEPKTGLRPSAGVQHHAEPSSGTFRSETRLFPCRW